MPFLSTEESNWAELLLDELAKIEVDDGDEVLNDSLLDFFAEYTGLGTNVVSFERGSKYDVLSNCSLSDFAF